MKLKAFWAPNCEPRFNAGDAGLDLRAKMDTPIVLNAGDIAQIPTGLMVEFPEGYCGLVMPRSSTGKNGLFIQNTVPVIDNSFTGEIVIHIGCRTRITLEPYERFAQLVIMPYYQVTELEYGEPRETERGDKGFGSSGRN